MKESVQQVFDYHQATKHHFNRYARGPGHLDWASQPDPFRRYFGAPLFHLGTDPPTGDLSYDLVFAHRNIPPSVLDVHGLSRLLLDSLALSAWKRAGAEAWALRVNPSSGNLHPTEGYVILGPMAGVDESPLVCHYAPREHALELRARFPVALWRKLIQGLPEETILLGLTSIHWREAWKYGERAYRYCQLDVGHALATISMAAAGLGWQARLVDGVSTESLSCLFGVFDPENAETEEPDCLVAIYPRNASTNPPQFLTPDVMTELRTASWQGRPNRLSAAHVKWQAIDAVSQVCRKPPLPGDALQTSHSDPMDSPPLSDRGIGFRRIIHQRRSAVAMDGITSMSRPAFFDLLLRTLPAPQRVPFFTLPWEPHVHLALFVHRVDGLSPGLYFLARNSGKKDELRSAMQRSFLWQKPPECPDALELYLLKEGDVRKTSMQISCFQDIASDGCFSVAMIAAFERPLNQYGSWFYQRLFWECGMIGQVIYLEAEAAGLRGTGIGCFFDDPTHELLGLKNHSYQDLYHFTVGGPIEDPRLTTLPPYPLASR